MTVVDPAQLLALTDPDLQRTLVSLLVITAVAAIVPLIVGLLRLRIAEVVLLLGFGVLVGPQVLGWVEMNESIDTFNELGLGMLFFLAGYELEQRAVTGESGRLAITGWVTSLVLACIIVAGLWATDVVSDFLGVAIALTSTALGTLLPVIRDRGMLETKFGTMFMGAGAAGEFGPILAITLLLGSKSVGLTLVVLVIFAVIAVLLYFTPGRLATERLVEVVNRGHSTSSQTAVRWTVVLLLTLLVLSSEFGFDAVLGAFIAGVILRRYSPPSEANKLLPKIEAIGFGLFIPLFFIVSGVNLDIDSIVENPWRLLLFFVLMLLVRGVPQYVLYRHAFPDTRERWQFALYVATALPILVAITGIEVDNGIMRPENAAAIVGAGALSILVFPLLGDRINKAATTRREAAEPETTAHD